MEAIPLTEVQIKTILDAVPPIPGIGKTARKIALTHFKSNLRDLLTRIKLVPKEEAFQELKRTIVEDIYRSQIEPGKPVGMLAGVSVGRPTTQLSLNTFHFIGALSGVASAFQDIRAFITGSEMNRNPQMRVFFKYPNTGTDLHDVIHQGTFDSILALRPELEQTTVEDLVEDHQILTKEEAKIQELDKVMAIHAHLRPDRFERMNERFPMSHVMMLKLNTYRMYTHRITMAMVSRAIEGPDESEGLTCIWKSQQDGRIYILIDETKDYKQQGTNHNTALIMHLNIYVLKSFPKWVVSGMEGITRIIPIKVEVVSGISRVVKSPREADTWYVHTTHRKTRWDGISLGDIYFLLASAGYDVGRMDKENLNIKVRFAGDLMADLQQKLRALTDEKGNLKSKLTPEQEQLYVASQFHYATTNGINMDEIVWRDDVDLYRCASNDSHDINRTLGIDAARMFMIFKFQQNFQEFGIYVNPRHISLIFDLLTNLGMVNRISFVGINRRKAGALTLMTNARAYDVLSNTAIMGEVEQMIGVSESLYIGSKMKKVGTGSVGIELDLTVLPQDPPPRPQIEETMVVADIVESGNIIEGTGFAEELHRAEMEEERREISMIGPHVVPPTTQITGVPIPQKEDIIPSGGQLMLASETLERALKKVMVGTNVELVPEETIPQVREPEISREGISNIQKLEDWTGIALTSPKPSRPKVARPSIKPPTIKPPTIVQPTVKPTGDIASLSLPAFAVPGSKPALPQVVAPKIGQKPALPGVEVPKIGAKPALPEVPKIGEKPVLPEVPKIGAKPALPEVPKIGEKPTLPGVEVPKIGQKPALPGVEVPKIGQKPTLPGVEVPKIGVKVPKIGVKPTIPGIKVPVAEEPARGGPTQLLGMLPTQEEIQSQKPEVEKGRVAPISLEKFKSRLSSTQK